MIFSYKKVASNCFKFSQYSQQWDKVNSRTTLA